MGIWICLSVGVCIVLRAVLGSCRVFVLRKAAYKHCALALYFNKSKKSNPNFFSVEGVIAYDRKKYSSTEDFSYFGKYNHVSANVAFAYKEALLVLSL